MYDTKNDTNLRRLEADQTTYHTASVDGTEINFEKLCVRRSTQTNFISFSIHMICESSVYCANRHEFCMLTNWQNRNDF